MKVAIIKYNAGNVQSVQYALQRIGVSSVVTDDAETIQKADKIIVMEKGEIVEMGTHQELILRSGYYKNLFDLQFRE